jgi:hypothetical protein
MDLLNVYNKEASLEMNLTNLIAAQLNVQPEKITLDFTHRSLKKLEVKIRFIPVWFDDGETFFLEAT